MFSNVVVKSVSSCGVYCVPLKIEQIKRSETSAYINQTPGNHPKENKQQTISFFTSVCLPVYPPVCLSVHPLGTTRLSMDRRSKNLLCEYTSRIC